MNLLIPINMSMKNILVLTVLMIPVIHNSNQAEIIRGMEIPRLNVTGIVGKWYLTGRPVKTTIVACATPIFKQLSANNFTVTANFTLTHDAIAKNHTIRNDRIVIPPLSCTMNEDSNIITGTTEDGLGAIMLVFDVDYDSYMAIYVTTKIEAITTGTRGTVIILSRQPTLPEGIMDKVKQTSFYQQGMYPYETLEIDEACNHL